MGGTVCPFLLRDLRALVVKNRGLAVRCCLSIGRAGKGTMSLVQSAILHHEDTKITKTAWQASAIARRP